MVDAAHFIGLVAGKAIPSPMPYADVVSFTTHKVLRGPRGGMILCREELGQRIDKAVFPFLQGGPLMHVIAAKAVALKEAASPAYQEYARQVIANAQALVAGLQDEGMRAVSGGTDTHLALIDLEASTSPDATLSTAATRPGSPSTRTPFPFDPEKPMVASGDSGRHPVGDDSGHGSARDERGRFADWTGRPRRPRHRYRSGRDRPDRRGGLGACGQVPGLS